MTSSLISAQNFLAALPEELPVFPLSGAVLLPQARLPLNIFEMRYRAMVEDALGKGRLIGMIQPSVEEEGENPPLYSVGCAGRITSFNEVDDGRLLIVLTGVCRFRVLSELPLTRAYRIVKPEWTPYLADLGEGDPDQIDRERLIELMRIYFKKNAISVDWSVVKNAPNDVLLPTIIMICPLAPAEKQALLEAESVALRAQMLMALLEMAALPQPENEVEVRH
jgi:Lon protease-like protein